MILLENIVFPGTHRATLTTRYFPDEGKYEVWVPGGWNSCIDTYHNYPGMLMDRSEGSWLDYATLDRSQYRQFSLAVEEFLKDCKYRNLRPDELLWWLEDFVNRPDIINSEHL